MPILVATDPEVVVVDVDRCTSAMAHGIGDRPTCLAAGPLVHGCAWLCAPGRRVQERWWRKVLAIGRPRSPDGVVGMWVLEWFE
jgi:hypothetical protein